jgi:hypothetical protein
MDGTGETERWHVAAADAGPEVQWRMLAWCAAHGADEFTLEVMALADTPAALADAFEDDLAPFERPVAVRPVLEEVAGPVSLGRVRRWTLDAHTLRLLRRFLPGGPLAYGAHGPGEAGWLENLTLYRDGELLFAAVTHEGAGALVVRAAERAALEALGVPLRAPDAR